MNPPDAPVLGTNPPIDLVRLLLGHISRVFHKLRVEIHHVERAVGTGREIHRMEPWIRGSENLPAFLRSTRLESHASRHEHPPMDEVPQRFAHEKVALVLLTQSVAAIDHGPG